MNVQKYKGFTEYDHTDDPDNPHIELQFLYDIDQEVEVDQVNDYLMECYGQDIEIDWRDPRTCWIRTNQQPDLTFLRASIGTNQVPPRISDLVTEYMLEAEHNSWEGWNRDELKVITAFLKDIATYVNVAIQMDEGQERR